MKLIRKRLAVVISIALTAGSFTVITAPTAVAMTGAGQQLASFVLGTLNEADGAPNIPTANQLASINPFAGPGASGFISARAGSGGVSTAYTVAGTTYGTSHVGGVTRTATVQVGAKMSFIATSSASAVATTHGVSVVVTGGTLTSLITTSSPINVNTATTGASITKSAIAGQNSLAGLFTVTAAAGETATLTVYTGPEVIDTTTEAGTTVTTWTFQVPRANLVLGNLADQDGTPDQPTAANLASTVSFDPLPTAVGWVANTSLANTSSSAYAIGSTTYGTSTTSGLARTGVVQSGAKISLIASTGATSGAISVVVTGGTLSGLITPTGVTPNLAGDARSASIFSAGNSITPALTGYHPLSAVFSVTAAAGSTATIAAYSGTGIINGDTRTSGTLIAIWTLTIAAANVAGTVNLAESTVTQQPCITYATTSGATNAFDTASRCGNGRLGVVYVELKDTFTSPIESGTLAATVTAGTVNVVGAYQTATGDNYAATTAFDSIATTTSRNYILVTQPVANAGGSSTVTITHNGAVVGTKTITWAGDVASIVVDVANSATVIANGVSYLTSQAATSYGKNVLYSIKDAAGNSISGLTPTLIDATGAMLGATLSTSTDASVTVLSSSATLNVGYATIIHPGGTATANFGAGSYKIQVLNSAGVAVKSSEIKVTVASQVTYSFTASFDKASYVPGGFATLTISAKDVFGNPMPTGKTLPGLVIAVSSGLTVAGAECTSASTFKAGVKTCTYAVGNTAGTYSWSVALTTATDQSPVTGVVKNVDSAVSNAEVLKSIVALIASINKQIAALQKLILKRK